MRNKVEDGLLVQRSMDSAIQELGHNIKPFQGGYLKCDECGRSWPKTNKHSILRMGQCPGQALWGNLPRGANLNRPRAIPYGTAIMWLGHQVHPSHYLAWHRGILYCKRCGYYCQKRVDKLTEPCLLKPPNASQARKLSRLREGKHPTSDKATPCTGGEVAPIKLQPYLDD